MATGIEELFRSFWPLVVGYLCRRTGDPGLAEELAQETFSRATGAILGWRGEQPAAWLLAIARNVLRDHARRGRPLVPLDESLLEAASPGPGPELEVRDLLGRLPGSQRRVLELVYLEGFSHAEVAAMTGTTPAAVKTLVWRARASLRAVWRGILRTAFTVLVGFLVLSMVWQVIGAVWFLRNEDHFKVVAGQGFYVAHPGYQFSPASCCNVGSALDGELTLNLSPRGPGGSGTLRIRENWLGRIDPLPQEVADNPTPAETALTFGPPDKAVTARLLDQLPAPMKATAIVEFAKPMDQAAFMGAGASHYDQPLTFHQTVFMSTVYPHARPTAVRIDQALAWPDRDVAAFRGWAAQLRKSDGANLETLRLPSARIIKQLAAEGRIHGLLIDSTSISQLRALLADRAVASIRVADVAFDLDQQSD